MSTRKLPKLSITLEPRHIEMMNLEAGATRPNYSRTIRHALDLMYSKDSNKKRG